MAPVRKGDDPQPGHAAHQVADNDQTAATIMRAAVVVMARHGFYGTTVRDIAAEAGISSGLIYHHFGSKHDLLVAVLDQGVERLVRRTEQALFDAPPDPASRLRAIVRAHVLGHALHPQESLLGNSELRSLQPAARALIIARRDTQQRMFDRVVADGVRRGVFSTRYPVEATRAIVTACTAVAGWFHDGGPLSAEEVADRYEQIALDAVGYTEEPAGAG